MKPTQVINNIIMFIPQILNKNAVKKRYVR